MPVVQELARESGAARCAGTGGPCAGRALAQLRDQGLSLAQCLALLAQADALRAAASQPAGRGGRLTSPEAYLSVFFTRSPASRQAGQQALQRMHTRTEDRDTATTWATREAQYDAVCSWGIPDHALLQRLSCLEMPVFVANGDSDPMIQPHYSYLLAGLIPQARVKIYPDSAHGFLFQHHADFAADVDGFLSGPH